MARILGKTEVVGHFTLKVIFMTYILMFNVCVLCVVYVCCRGGGGSYERVGVPALWCLWCLRWS